jgi:hypothetical protein
MAFSERQVLKDFKRNRKALGESGKADDSQHSETVKNLIKELENKYDKDLHQV